MNRNGSDNIQKLLELGVSSIPQLLRKIRSGDVSVDDLSDDLLRDSVRELLGETRDSLPKKRREKSPERLVVQKEFTPYIPRELRTDLDEIPQAVFTSTVKKYGNSLFILVGSQVKSQLSLDEGDTILVKAYALEKGEGDEKNKSER